MGYNVTNAGECVFMATVAGGAASGSGWPTGGVTISTFLMDWTEVTVEQYSMCVVAGSCPTPHTGQACNFGVVGRVKHPVNCVTWYNAVAYCQWAGKRLPTESEWQWAASNKGTTAFPWGNSPPDSSRVNWKSSGTSEVGVHQSGATQDGIQDLSGNVDEFVSDDYDSLNKVVKGGSWSCGSDTCLRATFHNGGGPTYWWEQRGFRCVK